MLITVRVEEVPAPSQLHNNRKFNVPCPLLNLKCDCFCTCMLKGKSQGLTIPEVIHSKQKDVFFPRDKAQLVQVTECGPNLEETVGKKIFLFFSFSSPPFLFFCYQEKCKPFRQWDRKPFATSQESGNRIHLGIAKNSWTQTQLSKNLNMAFYGLASRQRDLIIYPSI